MEKHFILHDTHIRDRALNFITTMPLEPLIEVVVKPFEKIRTLPQNSRYWANITEYLRQINQTITCLANESGHTPLDIKRMIAADLEPEYIAILFARSPEVVHDILKEVCNVPTSTKLGTKKFSEFGERMEVMIAEIVGQINTFRGAV